MKNFDDLDVLPFFNLSSDAAAIIDRKGLIHECNPTFYRFLQLPKSKIIHHNIQSLLPLYLGSEKVIAKNYPLTMTKLSYLKANQKYQSKLKNTTLNLTVHITPIKNSSIKGFSFFIVRELSPDSVINSEEITQNMPNLLIALSPKLIIEHVNQATLSELGYTEKEIIGKPLAFICGKINKKTLSQVKKTTAKNPSSDIEIDFKTNTNLLKPALLTTTIASTNKKNSIICVATDISKHKHEEETLTQLAHNDFLTGLANRLALETILQHEITVSSRHNRKIALLFIDLDQFKSINDKLGHHIGDLLLIAVANCLKQALRAEDFIARLSGDEFIVMLTDIKNEYTAGYIAEKIIKLLGNSFVIHIDHPQLT